MRKSLGKMQIIFLKKDTDTDSFCICAQQTFHFFFYIWRFNILGQREEKGGRKILYNHRLTATSFPSPFFWLLQTKYAALFGDSGLSTSSDAWPPISMLVKGSHCMNYTRGETRRGRYPISLLMFSAFIQMKS